MPNQHTWTIIIPTFRRSEVLRLCLKSLFSAVNDRNDIEIIILDNGTPITSETVVNEFFNVMPIRYIINEPGNCLGYSLSKGSNLANGKFILELNDDAILPNNFLKELESIYSLDSKTGMIGVRALEEGYVSMPGNIGSINTKNLSIVGNFDRKTSTPIDVEHVYGFCFSYKREILTAGASHDQTLLAKKYSSGNRIETDQCLAAKRLGYRVVYAGNIAVKHLAKPRPDIDERSAKWRVNHLRNTLYLFLKHFGLTGKKFIALRFAITHDLGIRSAILSPSVDNVTYAAIGLYAKLSALYHWIVLLVSSNQQRKV